MTRRRRSPPPTRRSTSPANRRSPLPPLDEMDGFLRPLLAALSSRPELASWLATDDLVRQLATAIDQAVDRRVAGARLQGAGAANAVRPRPGAPTARTIDPASYRRYDGLVRHRHVDRCLRGREDLPHDPAAAERGVSRHGQSRSATSTTPCATRSTSCSTRRSSRIRSRVVEGGGASWDYADPDLESLTPTQKQLVRMGPAHTRDVAGVVARVAGTRFSESSRRRSH